MQFRINPANRHPSPHLLLFVLSPQRPSEVLPERAAAVATVGSLCFLVRD